MTAPIYWVEPDDPLPPAQKALKTPSGLVAAGNDLSAARVLEAYRGGIFPWYGRGQPVLWWSPDPRMVLPTGEMKVSDSLAKKLRQVQRLGAWSVRTDTAFESVMRACAAPRDKQGGTWIDERIIQTYVQLHHMGYAHSVEVWEQGKLIGGLYGMNIGRMFFGESMFARATDASKVALACLTQKLLLAGCPMIDCQQNTTHLASMGGREIKRRLFLAQLESLIEQPAISWAVGPLPIADAAVLNVANEVAHKGTNKLSNSAAGLAK